MSNKPKLKKAKNLVKLLQREGELPQPNNQFIQEAVEEFREKFIQLHPKMDCTKPTPIWNYEALKNFLTSKLKQQQQNMVERLEGLKKEELFIGETQYRFYKGDVSWVHNNALDDAIKLIKDKE